MRNRIKRFAKKVMFRYTDLAKPKYPYNVEPIQLAEIVKGIDNVVIPGKKICVVEVGVARGMTTRFIAEHIQLQRYNADYYCIDTFSSFTKNDLAIEVKERGKKREDLHGFAYNDYEVWKKNFKEFSFIIPVQCDCSKFDFSKIAPINFCFLDVDLYRPTKNVLNNIWIHMAPSSLLVVDDVLDNACWDGSHQAFMEFVSERNLDYKIIGNKCGILKKL